jgi:8-oxo-dGTP pyrophosphatase MutT (NUDIX family)
MPRTIRYQGAIIREHHLLLIRHREHTTDKSYWLFPGGGIEAGESAGACVAREMREEANVQVVVERLLLDEPIAQPAYYQRRRTYLCTIVAGEPSPGYEPEEDAQEAYGIVEVKWFDLRNADSWDEAVKSNHFTYPQLLRLQVVLGYTDKTDV